MNVRFYALVFGLVAFRSHAQDSLYVRLQKEENKLLLNGMLLSTGWSLGNTAWSIGALSKKPELDWQGFHEMNLAWSGVNLLVFGLGTAKVLMTKSYPSNLGDAYKAHLKDKKLFKVNVFLDLAYMISGVGMMALSEKVKDEENQERLYGYGSSVLFQGTYLFVFDGTMHALLKKRDRFYLE
jgi:hypothetical protein